MTFNSNDGSDIDSQTVDYGNTVAEPTAPTKNGYTFAGWYSDEGLVSAYDFSTTVTSDITLYAKWTKNSSGGSYTPPTYKPTINQSDEGGTVVQQPTGKHFADGTSPDCSVMCRYSHDAPDGTGPERKQVLPECVHHPLYDLPHRQPVGSPVSSFVTMLTATSKC